MNRYPVSNKGCKHGIFSENHSLHCLLNYQQCPFPLEPEMGKICHYATSLIHPIPDEELERRKNILISRWKLNAVRII